MLCICKAAISMDGYLDDCQAQRRVFSGPKDKAAVEQLRANADAILIGAETLRKDNPNLQLRSVERQKGRQAQGKPRHPLVVVLTRSGRIPSDTQLLINAVKDSAASPQVLLLCPQAAAASLRNKCVEPIQVRALSAKPNVDEILQVLSEYQVANVLVEGGAQTLAMFLASGRVDVLRLSVAPMFLAQHGRANLFDACRSSGFDLSLLLPECTGEILDDLHIIEYRIAGG